MDHPFKSTYFPLTSAQPITVLEPMYNYKLLVRTEKGVLNAETYARNGFEAYMTALEAGYEVVDIELRYND